MRNYFAIAFTCVYLVLTVGVAKTTHYCMGRLSHSRLYSFQAHKCPCFRYQSNPRACCKDVSQIITFKDDQSQAKVVGTASPVFFEIGILHSGQTPVEAEAPGALHASVFTDTSPPPAPPLFKLHCSFVFYG